MLEALNLGLHSEFRLLGLLLVSEVSWISFPTLVACMRTSSAAASQDLAVLEMKMKRQGGPARVANPGLQIQISQASSLSGDKLQA